MLESDHSPPPLTALLRVSFKLRLKRRQLGKRRIWIRCFLARFMPVLPVPVVSRGMSALTLMPFVALMALIIGALIPAVPPSISATRRLWRITRIRFGDRRLLAFGRRSGGAGGRRARFGRRRGGGFDRTSVSADSSNSSGSMARMTMLAAWPAASLGPAWPPYLYQFRLGDGRGRD